MVKLLSPLDQVDSSMQYKLGSRTKTRDGNEYIYLPGTTSVVQYDWVSFLTAATVEGGMSYGSVTRLLSGAVGDVGIAQGAIVSNKFGWFQVGGIGWGLSGGVSSAAAALYGCASGSVGYATGSVSSSLIARAFSIQASATAGGTVKALIYHPFTTATMS